MTAFERAAEDLVSAANGAVAPSKSRTLGSGMPAWRAGLALCLSDVIEGMRWVSHNALAMVGLSAVAAALFLMSRPELRHGLETQALSWLTERASVRAGLSSDERSDNEVLLAVAEPEAIQRATAANPAELNRQQSAVAYWISRRYNVAPEPISRLVQEAWQVGQRVGMEPTLVLAVMAVESGFNPFAQSHVGAQGLMQVMTRVHHDKYEIFGGQNAAFDPVTNLRVGVQVLKDCIRRAGSLEGGLKYYVGAANMVDDGGYAAKVLAEQSNLRQVAQGRKVAVNVPLPQPAVAQAASPAAVSRPEGNAGAAPAAPAASDSAPLPRRLEQVAMLTP